MNRRQLGRLLAAALATHALPCSAFAAGNGVAWTRVPAIAVVGAADDPRQLLVRDAVAFWNRTLAALGLGFRLGAITPVGGTVPDDVLVGLSAETLAQIRTAPMPEVLRSVPGDLIVVLSDAEFVSFSWHWRAEDRGLVAIRTMRGPPMSLPNVARNVIAHEFGHAIGLAHNGDPAMLMCGRPAPCRPNAFKSDTEHYFPLTADERALLASLYPAGWRPR